LQTTIFSVNGEMVTLPHPPKVKKVLHTRSVESGNT